MPTPDGKLVMHAELRLGSSRLYVCDEMPGADALSPRKLRGTSVSLHLWVEDCDAAFDRAVEAGARVSMPLTDAFWGDRYGRLIDPFGHAFAIATHKEDVSVEQMVDRAAAHFSTLPEVAAPPRRDPGKKARWSTRDKKARKAREKEKRKQSKKQGRKPGKKHAKRKALEKQGARRSEG